jgi:hypothetical protein
VLSELADFEPPAHRSRFLPSSPRSRPRAALLAARSGEGRDPSGPSIRYAVASRSAL